MSKKNKIALLTGCNGQDGAWLAKLLLDKGYEVYGGMRRSSTRNIWRLEYLGIEDQVKIIDLDLLEYHNIHTIVRDIKPDEFYNLAAQSFVGVSFKQPITTSQINGMGVAYILDILKNISPKTKFYQASTSEMYGKARELPLKETSPFYPRSPYGCAKVYAHWMTTNYRESYDMFCCLGILFNHECLDELTPIIIKKNNIISIVSPRQLIPLIRKGKVSQTYTVKNTEIWDGFKWTNLKVITATKRKRDNPDHQMLAIQTRSGIIKTTSHHRFLDKDKKIVKAADVQINQEMLHSLSIPNTETVTFCSLEMAELFGFLVGDGYISPDGHSIRFTNNDLNLRNRVRELWRSLFLASTRECLSSSGFKPENKVHYIEATGVNHGLGLWLRNQLYTINKLKKVPEIILNSSNKEVISSFLKGYYASDGLKKGNGLSIKTNSPFLAQGLYVLYKRLDQDPTTYMQVQNERSYYVLNIKQKSNKGRHLIKNPITIRKTEEINGSEWVYDLETESGYIQAGVGSLIVHNSELRGPEFVTRKITHHVARRTYDKSYTKTLKLGNLDALRDWGYAKEYVEGMYLMMQQDKSDTYVLASGGSHSVRDFVEFAFAEVGEKITWEGEGTAEIGHNGKDVLIEIDKELYRPAEVDVLVGDATKAKEKLEWEAKTDLQNLVKIMVESDSKVYITCI